MILYGDIFFILNFIMNLFLILITAMLRQKRCRWCRFLLMAALQAAISLVFLYIFWGRGLLLLFSALFQMIGITVGAFVGQSVFLSYHVLYRRCDRSFAATFPAHVSWRDIFPAGDFWQSGILGGWGRAAKSFDQGYFGGGVFAVLSVSQTSGRVIKAGAAKKKLSESHGFSRRENLADTGII